MAIYITHGFSFDLAGDGVSTTIDVDLKKQLDRFQDSIPFSNPNGGFPADKVPLAVISFSGGPLTPTSVTLNGTVVTVTFPSAPASFNTSLGNSYSVNVTLGF
jgi:hypothetical protein